jgi:hypothetical protein
VLVGEERGRAGEGEETYSEQHDGDDELGEAEAGPIRRLRRISAWIRALWRAGS